MIAGDGIPFELRSEGSTMRYERWIDAGSPEANLGRLTYQGDDIVRVVLGCVLEVLPPSVRWHAVEWITWRECGRSARGWKGIALPRRDPPGDIGHEITLCGKVDDEALCGIIGHELAHSIHADILLSPHARAAAPWMPDTERKARRLILGRDLGLDAEALAQRDADAETLADRTAAAWGLARTAKPDIELQRALADYNEASELVPAIERSLRRRQ